MENFHGLLSNSSGCLQNLIRPEKAASNLFSARSRHHESNSPRSLQKCFSKESLMTSKDAEKGARVLNCGSRNGRGLTYVEGDHVLRTSQGSWSEITWISQQLLSIPRKPVCWGWVCVALELLLIIHAQNAVDCASILRTCVSPTSHLSPRKLWNRKLLRKLKR